MPPMHTLRDRLTRGMVCSGPFLKIPDPVVTELAGLAGFDFVVIDLEHSPFSMETTVGMVRAASARGIAAIVRVTDNAAPELSRALDTGATGVIVPHVTEPEDAVAVVDRTRFHPVGSRGMDVYARAAGWGHLDRDTYMRAANEETIVGVMVEGAGAVDHLDAIASVEGLDLLFIGPYDLSQSLGIPGQVTHPEVVGRIESAVKIAQSHDRVLGLYVDDVEAAERYSALGVQFIGMSNDADILRQAFCEIVASTGDDAEIDQDEPSGT